jgi:Methyltransferase domain
MWMTDYLASADYAAFIRSTLAEMGQALDLAGLADRMDELTGDRRLLDHIEAAVRNAETFRTKTWETPLELGIYRFTVFALFRELRPRMAIETGVLHGLTTLFMLEALRLNGSGTLHSVDLPSYHESGPANQDGIHDLLPPGRQPGWIIGDGYAPQWRLHLGASRDVLPSLSAESAALDFFLHDSEHTLETMTLELEWAWEHLAPGGLLMCDNTDYSTAFFTLCRRVGRIPFVVAHTPGDRIKFALIRK